MGIDYTVYVGPFLKCKNAKVDGERTIRTCTKPSCKQNKKESWDRDKKFCEECGSPIGDVVIKVKQDKVDCDPSIVNDKLMIYRLDAKDAHGYDVWISNQYRQNRGKVREFSFDPKSDGEQYVEISIEMIRDEMQEFVQQFEKQIDKLTRLYGEDNVELKWGLIHEIN